MIPEYRIIAIYNGCVIELESGFTNYDEAIKSAQYYENDYKGVNVEQY